jgi:hypothetical protein
MVATSHFAQEADYSRDISRAWGKTPTLGLMAVTSHPHSEFRKIWKCHISNVMLGQLSLRPAYMGVLLGQSGFCAKPLFRFFYQLRRVDFTLHILQGRLH